MNKCALVRLAFGLALLPIWADVSPVLAQTAFEHCLFDSVSLDGAWEMSYRPYDCESVAYPTFEGKLVEKAIPGYWEDMVPAFRAAGLCDEFRLNPQCSRQTFPIFNAAEDLTLPNIRGSFLYRRTVARNPNDPSSNVRAGAKAQP